MKRKGKEKKTARCRRQKPSRGALNQSHFSQILKPPNPVHKSPLRFLQPGVARAGRSKSAHKFSLGNVQEGTVIGLYAYLNKFFLLKCGTFLLML